METNGSRAGPSVFKNEMLAALPAEILDALRPNLVRVTIVMSQVLHEVGTPIDDVYFVEDGLISLTADTHDDGQVEVGLIGRDGIAGLSVLLIPGAIAYHRTFVQVASSALRMRAAKLRELGGCGSMGRGRRPRRRSRASKAGLRARTPGSGSWRRCEARLRPSRGPRGGPARHHSRKRKKIRLTASLKRTLPVLTSPIRIFPEASVAGRRSSSRLAKHRVRTPKMAVYEIYRLDWHGNIALPGRAVICHDDHEALVLGTKMIKGFEAGEVRQGTRVVGRMSGEKVGMADDGADGLLPAA